MAVKRRTAELGRVCPRARGALTSDVGGGRNGTVPRMTQRTGIANGSAIVIAINGGSSYA
jgi:hypothetical protein